MQLRNNHATRNPVRLIWVIARTEGFTALYTGCSSLVIGGMGKAAVRFLTFDTIKARLADSSGKLSGGRAIMAGMGAGVVESLLAVTPTERIKTALIDDAKGAHRFRNGFHAVQILLRGKGIAGLYTGLAATTAKQAATSAVRMGTYSILKENAKASGWSENGFTTFAMGAAAGTVTVYATQPFDTIKTRAQGVAGASPLEAMKSVLSDSGIRGFWKGSTMRLGRLWLSGGIIFSVYERISAILTRHDI